jgi:formate-dependent nitrite reductase cytochrome c552 subunit
LVIDRSLLLDDAAEEKPDRSFLKVNQACYVCHGNYEEEPLAVIHAKEGVGCADCHGKSFAHRNDEDNITPPDVMYPLEAIDEACQECHDTHDASARDVIARWQQRCPEKMDASTLVCTDCHGQHRLKMRVVRWNKKTGELIIRAAGTKPLKDEPAEEETGN